MNDYLFLQLSGSRAYGTNRQDSDYDYRGVFVEPVDQILGSSSFVGERRKMDDNIDSVDYGLKKFMALTMNGNPNIVELWFGQEYILRTPEWNSLLEYRQDILSQAVVSSYLGWAKSTLSTLDVRWDNKSVATIYRILRNAKILFSQGYFSPRLDEGAVKYYTAILNDDLPHDKVVGRLQELYTDVKEIKEKDKWPAAPRMDRINRCMYDIYQKAYES